MVEREVILDEPKMDEQSEKLRIAVERAERAEHELAKLKSGSTSSASAGAGSGHAQHEPALSGLDALQQDSMMRHLLESLEAGKDIGHYGRLVFAMVARHFLSHDEMLTELMKDPDFSQQQASAMLTQVEDRNYSPPRRERIAEWQAQQEFPILPSPHDPDCGNVYRSLHFPDKTYKHIEEYQEEQMQQES
jgi:hypothetical protein